MSCGSLYGVIHSSAWDVERPMLLRLALDGSKGLAFLHGRSPPVVHRDVKSPNLLVSQDWAGKLSDFGLSQTTRTAERPSTHDSDTVDASPMWASPEAMRGEAQGPASDVFSMCSVVFECLTLKNPIVGVGVQAMRVAVVDRGLRPDLELARSALRDAAMDDDDATHLLALLERGWKASPEARPSAHELLGALQRVLTRHPARRPTRREDEPYFFYPV